MIYSVRLIGGIASATPETLYTVTGSVTVVVRDITLTNVSASSASTSLGVQVSGSFLVPIFNTGSLAAGAQAHLEGRWVMSTGDALVLTSTALNWAVYVSGYSLS